MDRFFRVLGVEAPHGLGGPTAILGLHKCRATQLKACTLLIQIMLSYHHTGETQCAYDGDGDTGGTPTGAASGKIEF